MIHKTRWTAPKIGQRIELVESMVYRRREPMPPFRYRELADAMTEPPVDPALDDQDWAIIQGNTHWGKGYTNFIMRGQFSVPSDWESDRPAALYLPLGEAGDFSHPEALAYIDGVPFAACDRHHQEIILDPAICDGADHPLALHGWTGMGGFAQRKPEQSLFMQPCEVVQIDLPTRNLVATARVALGIAENLGDDDPAKGRLLNALDAAFGQLDLREPMGDLFYNGVPAAHAVLREALAKAGAPLQAEIVASGHAHIDVAWLWTLGQTRRKAGRTFHNVLRLMEQFPDYHFTQSQPQLYDYVQQDYPELFEAIRQRIAEGRWEPIGGMWVEADCNLSGSESLARQFLLGRTYFREAFGADAESPVLWLPDVFGYAWNLPQLIKEAGLEYFFTIKIGWSQYNRLPYDSFWWQGLDGTKVLTHFSTTPDDGAFASTYNANASPKQALGTWTNFQQKETQSELLMAFGFGDGGGGPTREMLENIREMADFPAAPRMKQSPVAEFYRNLESTCGDRLPTWNGELYLELHRGTYTTQSRNKWANRKSEFLLHDAEFVATLAQLLAAEYEYPRQELNKAWELVCLNQFHDIIPGSSIAPVYVESQAQYATVREMTEGVRERALEVISKQMGGDLLLLNPIGFERRDLVFWPGKLAPGQLLRRADGAPVSLQETETGTWIDAGPLPALSVTELIQFEGEETPQTSDLTITTALLENQYLRIELNERGELTRLYDKAEEREVLPIGSVANQFQAFEDRPLNWDAWDVDIFYDDKMYTSDSAATVTVVEAGPLRATLEVRHQILNSDYVQRISLEHDSRRVDFDTTIEWRERHILLKVAFPVEILSPTATYEIQWGNVERPTHRNTSWDWARFETCAQKWVDLSEGDYGVSLLNDCKYGHDIHENVMRISLLRGPTLPDPDADLGEHHFAYSLLPHKTDWQEETVTAAYAINDRVLTVSGSGNKSNTPPPLISVVEDNVAIETIKQAEDGNGIIVRLYEYRRRRGPVTLTCGIPIAEASRVNLLEEPKNQLEHTSHSVTLNLHPFEIATVRLLPA